MFGRRMWVPTALFFVVLAAGAALELTDIVSGDTQGPVCSTCHQTRKSTVTSREFRRYRI
jgi:hypothetical protein